MCDDDDDRLQIDDHETSGMDGEEQERRTPEGRVNFTPPEPEENLPVTTNGISVLSELNMSREEGELDDDGMDVSPTKNNEPKASTPADRKRQNGENSAASSKSSSSPKKMKLNSSKEKKEQGTSVQTRASQADGDEFPFDMEAGSSFVMQMTVVCRLEGSNTMFVSGKWKDQELSGILTDGEPPGFLNFAKKRSALSNNGGGSESDKSSTGTPSKKRPGRGNEGKRKVPTKADDDDEELDVTGTGESRDGSSSGGSLKLVEVPSRTSMHICPFDNCGHRYQISTEMEYHIGTVHKEKAIVYEHSSSQTEAETPPPKKEMVSVFTDTEGLECVVVKKEKEETSAVNGQPAVAKVEGVVKSPSSRFSDISDDAPQLQKEEPHSAEGYSNGVTSRPSTSTPAAAIAASSVAPEIPQTPQQNIVHPSAVVPPVAASPRAAAANSLLMSYSPFIPPFAQVQPNTSVATPNREPNKLSQLKDPTSAVVAEAVAHTPSKPIASPAQSRAPFAVPPMIGHPGAATASPLAAHQQQQQQQMQMAQQMQAMQQLMMQQYGMRQPFAIPGVSPSAQEQMNQLAAMQALQQGNFMFPKH